jgi:hypothetical protein
MNFQDESGLNPGINEIAPIVPGSRGGFGLYQLTGPRRVAYERFAQERGVDVADADAQLDFLMTELQGPESRAARSIMAAPDAGSAAAAIARDFLRPSKEHLDRRVARYTGQGSSRQPSNALSATSGQQQPPNAPHGQQNALSAMPSRQEQAQAMMQQFGPKTNALDPAAFQRPRQQTQLMGFGQGQNPFNQGMA